MRNVLINAGNTVRVDSCNLQPSAASEWFSVPLLGMPPEVCKQLISSPESSSGLPHGWRSLERLVAAFSSNNALTGFKCTPIFSVRTLKQFLYSNSFFQHLKRRRDEVYAVRHSSCR